MRSHLVSIASPWPWLVGALMAAGSACGGSVTSSDGGVPSRDGAPGAAGDDGAPDGPKTLDATVDGLAGFDAAEMETGVLAETAPPTQDAAPPVDARGGEIDGSSSTDARGEASAPVDSAAPDGSAPDGSVACSAMSGNDCVTCCAAANPSGRGELDIVGAQCMCATCSSSCMASTCTAHALPKSPCIACVQQSLANNCTQNGYLDQYCGTSECRAYLNCLSQCPN